MAKQFHELTHSATDFAADDYIAVDGATNKTRKMSKDDLLAKTAQNALGSIKNLTTTATESDLVSGNYLAIDGAGGTKKLPVNLIAKSKYGTDKTHSSMDDASDADIKQDTYLPLDVNGTMKKLASNIFAKNDTITIPVFSGRRSTYATHAQDTNISLDAGNTYMLSLKSTSLSDGDTPFAFYQNGVGFCEATAQEIYDGVTAVYTPTTTANLFIRTYNSTPLNCDLTIKKVVPSSEILEKHLTLVGDVFNFTAGTTAVTTGITLNAGKLYKLFVKTATTGSYAGVNPVLYQNGKGLVEASAAQLASGVSIFFAPTTSAELYIRTWNSSYMAFEAKIEEVTLLDDVKKNADEKIPNSTIEKAVSDKTFTAGGTTFYSTNIRLCKGKKYRIFCKTTSLISVNYQLIYLYSRDLAETGGVSQIANCVAGELYKGVTIEYTPTDNIVLQYRTWEASIEMRIVVTELIGNANLHDTKLIRKQLDKVTFVSGVTTAVYTTIIAPANRVTKINVKSTALVTDVQTIRAIYKKDENDLNAVLIGKCEPQELYDGYEISICPPIDWIIGVRTEQGGMSVYATAETECENETIAGGSNSVVAVYGDSITAISNGNDKCVGWAKHFSEECNIDKFYGRGIGGSRYSYSWGGGAVTFVSADDGSYNSRNESYNKDNYTGEVPAGCVAIRSALCSWDRITNMFPASIKDNIDYVILFGGANDADSEIVDEAEFVVGSTTDPEWSTSAEYATYGGDFNISCMRGALASCVMKFQAWMPNAKIIVATPISGQGTTGQISTNLFIKMYDKSVQIKEIASRCSCPCIDVYGTDGISPFNRTTYITDSVHPYNDAGKRAVGVALARGFMRVLGTYNF